MTMITLITMMITMITVMITMITKMITLINMIITMMITIMLTMITVIITMQLEPYTIYTYSIFENIVFLVYFGQRFGREPSSSHNTNRLAIKSLIILGYYSLY